MTIKGTSVKSMCATPSHVRPGQYARPNLPASWLKYSRALSSRFLSAIFSADGTQFAFIMGPGSSPSAVVLNGKAQPTYSSISQLKFSPDGKHLAYVATKEVDTTTADGTKRSVREFFVVNDGVEGPHYQEAAKIDQLTFSADGKHFAYVAHPPVKPDDWSRYTAELMLDGASKLKAGYESVRP